MRPLSETVIRSNTTTANITVKPYKPMQMLQPPIMWTAIITATVFGSKPQSCHKYSRGLLAYVRITGGYYLECQKYNQVRR